MTPTQSGVNLAEFYADNLSPGDSCVYHGKVDLAGSGELIANTDSGFGLWTSGLTTTNSWINVTLPSVSGFFAGAAMH